MKPSPAPAAVAAVAALALAAGCITRTHESLPGLADAIIRPLPAVRAWTVEVEGERVGSVLRYQEQQGSERFIYSVRNVHGQDLGLVDEQGRAYRFRPHREDEWMGTGPVKRGVLAILGLGPEARVREVGLEGIQAPPTPER